MGGGEPRMIPFTEEELAAMREWDAKVDADEQNTKAKKNKPRLSPSERCKRYYKMHSEEIRRKRREKYYNTNEREIQHERRKHNTGKHT
jgi:hypothetical protein